MEGIRSTGFFKKSELNQHRDEKNRHSEMNSTESRRVVAKGLGRGRNGVQMSGLCKINTRKLCDLYSRGPITNNSVLCTYNLLRW